MYPIVRAPNEILRQPTEPISFSGQRLTEILSEMKKTLVAQRDPEGVGLAANQVGLPYRIFLARFDTKPGEIIRAYINPKILSHSEEMQPVNEKKSPLEGCLSLPKYYGVVKRWKKLTLGYEKLSESGKLESVTEEFEDFPAVVIQHEMDHLDGKIFVEKILEQQGKLYKVSGKDEEGKEIWDEVEFS